ncbi:MAG: phospholipid carrier-dependent glycosyltransferase [bacterium]
MTLPRWVHYAAAASILSLGYFSGLANVRMHNNESAWIGTSYYFEAFLGDDVSQSRPDLPADVWSENFWTLTQPPLALYVLGVARRLGGLTITDLNEPWVHNDARINARDVPAQVPSTRLLLWSRGGMTFLSVVSGLLLFFIVARCAGFIAAYAFLGLFVTNPFLLETLRRAMGDPVVTVFGIAALAVTILGLDATARDGRDGRPRASRARLALWAIAAGACCGLSGAAKLNGLSAAFGVATVVFVVVAFARRPALATAPVSSSPPVTLHAARWGAATVAVALVAAAASVAFIAPSPYLRRGPIHGTLKMLEHRQSGVARQRQLNPVYPVDGVIAGALNTGYRVLFKPAPLRFPGAWVFSLSCMLVGFGVLLRDALRGVKARAPNASFALVVVGATQTIPSIFSPLDFDRYYLFPTLFANVCLAIGFAVVTARAAQVVGASTRHSRRNA